jgi:O-antigen/teichoic acid export membrane protein
MRLTTLQIVAALFAAVAMTLAFMAAGAGIAAFLLAAVGAGALAWVVYGVAKRWLLRRRPAA